MEFYVNPNQQDRKRKYCSKECFTSTTRGIKRPSWIGEKVSKSKMGHGWPEGYSQRQSIAQKKRFKSEKPWNKGKSLIGIYSDDKTGSWKGDKAGRKALDQWAKRRIPKPKRCELCKSKKPLEMSNKSQKYKRDTSDWQWICKKCHRNYDGNSHKAWITRRLKNA